MRPGMTLVDCTTADPAATRRIGAELARAWLRHGRRGPGAHAEGGRGRPPQHLCRRRPGHDRPRAADPGDLSPTPSWSAARSAAGTTCKLVNNSITIGMCAVIAEGLATAAKLGVDLEAQARVLSAGGADGRMWQMMAPWIPPATTATSRARCGSPRRTCGSTTGWPRVPASRPSSPRRSARPTGWRSTRAMRERFMPVLPGILAELNGAKIRDLDE